MICTLTARRLKPGAEQAFKEAFMSLEEEIPEEINKRWKRVYICRDVADESVTLSFGFFDGTLAELREVQQQFDAEAQQARLAPHIDEILLDGSYEVLEEIEP